MSLALVQLFGFGHTQSDDIAAKSTKKLFQSTVLEKIKKDKILIADRSVLASRSSKFYILNVLAAIITKFSTDRPS